MHERLVVLVAGDGSGSEALQRAQVATRMPGLTALATRVAPQARIAEVGPIARNDDQKAWQRSVLFVSSDSSPLLDLFVRIYSAKKPGIAVPFEPQAIFSLTDVPFVAIVVLSLMAVGMWLRSDRIDADPQDAVEIVVTFALLLAANAASAALSWTPEMVRLGYALETYALLVVGISVVMHRRRGNMSRNSLIGLTVWSLCAAAVPRIFG